MENCANIEIKEDNVIKSKKLKVYNIPSGRFCSINKNFLRTANITLLVFDVTNIDSFIELYDCNELLMENGNLIKCVIANKNYLIKKRKISEEDGKIFAKKIGAFYYEINAYNKEDINDLFSKIMEIYSKPYDKIHLNSIYLKKRKKEKKDVAKEGLLLMILMMITLAFYII